VAVGRRNSARTFNYCSETGVALLGAVQSHGASLIESKAVDSWTLETKSTRLPLVVQLTFYVHWFFVLIALFALFFVFDHLRIWLPVGFLAHVKYLPGIIIAVIIFKMPNLACVKFEKLQGQNNSVKLKITSSWSCLVEPGRNFVTEKARIYFLKICSEPFVWPCPTWACLITTD